VPIHTRRIQHQCDTCGFVFGKKEYLLDHMRKHTGEISPVCDICGQTFNKSLKLKEHYKLHRNLNVDGSFHKALPFRCHMCKEVFQQASVLGMHLATAHAETLYRCDMCDATFGDVRGKNHHMYNEHQMDAFHQKCVWCPVCSQGFTRHYNLKVHMYKAHGKEFIENNFSEAELEALFKSPPSASSSKSSSFMSPSENFFTRGGTFAPPSMAMPAANPMKPLHYFDQKKGTQVLSCQLCAEAFFRRSDLLIHLEGDHQIKLLCCLACGEKFMDLLELRDHSVDVHGLNASLPKRDASDVGRKRKAPSAHAQSVARRPGPASRTNAPQESRCFGDTLDAATAGSILKCNECGKVLQHKQSLASHMREEHGKHFGDNRWKGNAIVEKILDESVKKSPKKKCGGSKGLDANAAMCSVCEQVFPNPSSLRNHVVNVHINGQNFTCDLCGKAYLHQENLDEHIKSKHPDLHNRLQKLRDSMGVASELDAKKPKLDLEEDSYPTSGSYDCQNYYHPWRSMHYTFIYLLF
jgi:KRAB domain-containing zinc finger protein